MNMAVLGNEAEYIALCRATQGVVFLPYRVLLTMGVEQHQLTAMIEDN